MYSLVIVDDELFVRQGLVQKIAWESFGFKVVADFSDGTELLKYLKDNTPDVILTDIKMDGVDGIEIAKYISQKKLDIIVVFLSGYKDFEYAHSAIHYGVAEYLLKPISVVQVREIFTSLRGKLNKRDTNINGNKKEKILEYINSHFHENITLADVGDYVFLSPPYISKIIKEETGYNFTDLIVKYRMEKAKELLATSSMHVYQIAERVGYSNFKYFYKVFKDMHNMSPNEYRRRRIAKDHHDEVGGN